MLYIYSQSGVRMKQCKICYSTILPEDYVEWVITQENHKYILGKYKWVACDYCFACINIAKSSLWSLYLNTLLNVDCNNALTQILENPLPVYITEHLCLFDKPIKALYYHKQMYSAKLNTGLTDFQYYHMQDILNKYKAIHKKTTIDNIENLLCKMQV